MTHGTPALTELPLGAIRPSGWLLDQLRLQAAGQTGQLDEIWSDVGPDSGWLGGDGEDWERGPYYLDGLLPLAHVLDDESLKAKASKWVEAILGSQRGDGQFGPGSNDDWWPRMVALKVLTQHADATGDQRVEPFLEHYFRYQQACLPLRPLHSWGQARGADNVLSVLWLHERTREQWLIDLAQLLLRQTSDWVTFLVKQLPPGPVRVMKSLTHCVNVAMGLKTPALNFLIDGADTHRDDVHAMYANLERLHGLVHGVFSGDEWLGGRDPHHGVETCEVVELMFSVEQLARVFGEGRYGDLLELIAFNLLPASNDPRMLAHQYHQQANQVLATYAARDWSFSGDAANVFGLEPNFGCCTANLHQGWPKFVRSLWMQSSDGLTAVAYAPCTVTAVVGDRAVRLDVRTSYPFEETIHVAVGVDAPADFCLRLRIPAWCTQPTLEVAGETVALDGSVDGYVAVRRLWHDGDQATLTLPMAVRTIPRDKGAVGVRLGPLVLAFAVGEVWRPVPDAPGLGEWEITPRSAWNMGLLLDDDRGGINNWHVERRPVQAVPFTADGAPIVVHARGALLPEWRLHHNSAGPLPQSPVAANLPVHQVRLLPYGCARLRVSELPVIAPATGTEDEDWVDEREWGSASE